MALLKTVTQEEAEGEIAATYDMFLKTAGTVPKPMEMASISPSLMKLQVELVGYYMNHPTLKFPLLAHIRYLVATDQDYNFCIDFNSNLLQFLGNTEEGLTELVADPAKADLDEKDKALLLFVLKALRSPDEVIGEEVDTLHNLGWKDSDIFDAVNHGAGMIAPSIMMRAFQIE